MGGVGRREKGEKIKIELNEIRKGRKGTTRDGKEKCNRIGCMTENGKKGRD